MQTYQEVYNQARTRQTKCRCCKVCNGIACAGETPGVGGKGTGRSFIRNVEKLKEVVFNMDSIQEDGPIDTSTHVFGQTFTLPVFAAPIAGVKNNYGADITDREYNMQVCEGCARVGSFAFSGDGMYPEMFREPLEAIAQYGGIATIKPWHDDDTLWRIKEAVATNACFAIATDIDASGLTILRKSATPVKSKSVCDLKGMKQACGTKPLIVKGILSVAGALKALEAGADAIVVSNHGGRVLDDCLAPIEVLPKIKAAVGNRLTILIDGGFQSGGDVFKALALGADGVLMGRKMAISAIGGGADGVAMLLEKVKMELEETMLLTGCASLKDITPDKVIVLK
ncbi:MAG: alpha-hydroxy-acid oxidizing protein [Erysipelotrichaceae bacterium]